MRGQSERRGAAGSELRSCETHGESCRIAAYHMMDEMWKDVWADRGRKVSKGCRVAHLESCNREKVGIPVIAVAI